MMPTSEDSESILLSALEGDTLAQQIVFTKYYGLVATVAWSAWPEDLRQVVSKDDLVQSILTRILQKLSTVDRTRLAEFAGWLKKVAVSAVADEARYWRAYEHRRMHTSAAAGSDNTDLIERYRVTNSLPEKAFRRDEAKEAILAAMVNLPKDQREGIHRKYFLGENHKEIAAAMDRSDGAVRELLRRAEENLETQLGTRSRWLSSR